MIVGFTNAAAIIIALSQLNKLLGVPMARSGTFLADVWGVLQQAGDTHLPTLAMGIAAFGLMLLLRFPQKVDDEALHHALLAEGIETLPLSEHYAGKMQDKGLLLSFAGFHEDDLERAASRLLAVLRSRVAATRG